jgi:translation initiation factor 1
MRNNDSNSSLVYSTSEGAICPAHGKAIGSCVCRNRQKATTPKTDGIVRLRYETKGRKGRGMTLIAGLALSEAALLDLARQLKQRFATGGAVKDYVIELQGDFRKQAEQELRKLGVLK